MVTFYLDTSAINHLFDDSRSSFLKETIQKHARVYLSIFTFVELASTSMEQRRIDLLRFAKEISGNFRPMAIPGDLLSRSLESVKDWEPDIDHFIAPEWDRVWTALNDPSLVDEEPYQEIKKNQEQWYQDMHASGRPSMQKAIRELPQPRQTALTSSFSKLIRHWQPDNQFLNECVCYIASRSGANVAVDKELVQRIIKHSEHWRFFLASMAYGMYVRSVKTSHFSKNKTPGSIDTQQAIYLTVCDVFVTADHQQRRMLRLLAPFGHKNRQVWDYMKFVQWLSSRQSNRLGAI